MIDKGRRRIPPQSAVSHIAALSLCNKNTLRDRVPEVKVNVAQVKNWDGAGRLGLWLAPSHNSLITNIARHPEHRSGRRIPPDQVSADIVGAGRVRAYILAATGHVAPCLENLDTRTMRDGVFKYRGFGCGYDQ